MVDFLLGERVVGIDLAEFDPNLASVSIAGDPPERSKMGMA